MPYEAKFVLLGFYSQNKSAGTLQEREQFRDNAFNRFDQHITDAAAEAGLTLSDESRSIIAMLATMATGAAPKTKAGQAVRAYIEYRGM